MQKGITGSQHLIKWLSQTFVVAMMPAMPTMPIMLAIHECSMINCAMSQNNLTFFWETHQIFMGSTFDSQYWIHLRFEFRMENCSIVQCIYRSCVCPTGESTIRWRWTCGHWWALTVALVRWASYGPPPKTCWIELFGALWGPAADYRLQPIVDEASTERLYYLYYDWRSASVSSRLCLRSQIYHLLLYQLI